MLEQKHIFDNNKWEKYTYNSLNSSKVFITLPMRNCAFIYSFCTWGGIYIFQLMDFNGITKFSHNFSFKLLSCCRLDFWWVVITFFKGIVATFPDTLDLSDTDNLVNIIEDMTGQKPSVFFKLCWKYFTSLLQVIQDLFSRLVSVETVRPLSFHMWSTSITSASIAVTSTLTGYPYLDEPWCFPLYLYHSGQICCTKGTSQIKIWVKIILVINCCLK